MPIAKKPTNNITEKWTVGSIPIPNKNRFHDQSNSKSTLILPPLFSVPCYYGWWQGHHVDLFLLWFITTFAITVAVNLGGCGKESKKNKV